jgi:hypothetical protein
MKNNAPTVMVLWHANPNPFAPPLLSTNQITGVLDEHSIQEFNYGTEKFSFPRGEFDLEALLKEKKIDRPDYLFVCLDSTTPYFARNIKNVCENSFLCLGDSHHLPQPITRLINYASSERFGGHIFTNNVRHAHWFKHRCDAEQYFEPALFALDLGSHVNESLKPINAIKKTPMFYGQMGQFHPRRARIMPNLIQKNLVRHISGSQEMLSTQLQQSIACINVTLNSDLNSRVFEIAQTGCLQIVDQLSIFNGHGSVLIPGHNCLTFTTEAELHDMLGDTNYLMEIGPILGENLKYEFNQHWGIARIKERLSTSIVSDSVKFNPAPKQPPRFKNINQIATVENRLFIYENLLELHRSNEHVSVYTDSNHALEYKQDLIDLPRIDFPEKDIFLKTSESLRIYIKDNNSGIPELFLIS